MQHLVSLTNPQLCCKEDIPQVQAFLGVLICSQEGLEWQSGIGAKADSDSQEWFCGSLSLPSPWAACFCTLLPSAGSVLVASGVQWNELCSNSLETIKGIKGILNITERVLRWVGPWCPQGWAALGLLKSHSGSFSSRLDPLKCFSLKTSLHIHLSNS